MKFGYNSWAPFFISLIMDLVSLVRMIIKQGGGLQAAIRSPEVNRRMMMLFVYLFRPPFFTNFSRIPIVKMFSLLQKLPVLGVVFSNILQLLLSLQSHFYYVNQY
jgi:hypothetical protein